MPRCPNHHDSKTTDFCSVCGAEIVVVGTQLTAANTSSTCPVCTAERTSSLQVHCELCGYNYLTGNSEIPPITSPGAIGHLAAGVNHPRWELVLQVDPNLHGSTNPDAPVGQSPQTFVLFESESIVGRAESGIRVQIPATCDPGVSRRHAMFVQDHSGNLAVRDLGSANGTELNGKALVPGVDTPVKDSDCLAIGAWTRITIQDRTQ